MKYGEYSKSVTVNLDGVKSLLLKVTGAPGNTHADWADARFTYSGIPPKAVWSPEDQLTIRESLDFVQQQNEKYPLPRINGAMKVGIRPNTPFYYPIAVTGKRPVRYQVEGLPEGLSVDKQTGIITGVPVKTGEYAVQLTVTNPLGKAQRTLKMVVGDQLAYTPPVGFLSWNLVEGLVNETFLKEMADAFVAFGFRDAGYQYINMDGCWQGKRGPDGRISPDIYRFPNGMKPIGDYLHEKGFKFGLYSSPGPLDCADYAGSFNFEDLDVDTWVSWGVDYLKYDVCSCPQDRKQELYQLMGKLLQNSGRSIVYCNSGYFGKEDAGSHLWRVGGDLRDQWMKSEVFEKMGSVGIVESFEMAHQYAHFQSPGFWNDPDMLVVGLYGKSSSGSDLTDGKGCTDIEYRSQMSLWALMSAPLFVTADIRHANTYTLETLINPEVIEVNQDPLGDFPKRIGEAGEQEIWVKQMEDGSKTVALFNKSSELVKMTVTQGDIALNGNYTVRDLWQRKNMGKFGKSYLSVVQPHEVVLIRIFKNQ
jgi:alpha-galactosidase